MRPAPALDLTLGVIGAALLLLGALQRVATETTARVLDHDPGMRAVALLFVLAAWMLLMSARKTATGVRRALGRVIAFGLLLSAATRVTGEDAFVQIDARIPLGNFPGLRALLAGVALLASSAFVYFTSPARRRFPRAR